MQWKNKVSGNVYIGPQSWINAICGLVICNGTIRGPRLTIYTANHRYKNCNAIPYDDDDDDVILPGKVEIEENTWVGGNVIIVANVKIGEGCIIAAGSVVAKDVIPFSVIGGILQK